MGLPARLEPRCRLTRGETMGDKYGITMEIITPYLYYSDCLVSLN